MWLVRHNIVMHDWSAHWTNGRWDVFGDWSVARVKL
jgi:hypothetical protein